MSGPLSGIRVLELAGIGPTPMCAMLLADAGAEVIRIDRVSGTANGVQVDPPFDLLTRGRRSLAIDLKRSESIAAVLRLVERADALVEGFRPGVAERLGLAPDVCWQHNPRLVYGRMTGWGQAGPLALAAGHDLNYIALTGALHAVGCKDHPPVPPLNLIGDFGGGALYLAFGVIAALLEARASSRGQVVEAAMVDGASSLLTMIYGLHAAGLWSERRGVNLLDGGAPFYSVYETKDRKYVAVGAIEERFYQELVTRMGLNGEELPDRTHRDSWPKLRKRFEDVFKERTRDEWCAQMEGSDACLSPVLSLDEAPRHPHMASRGVLMEIDGIIQPAPAPRFGRTPGAIHGPPPAPGEHSEAVLADWGFSTKEIKALRDAGCLG